MTSPEENIEQLWYTSSDVGLSSIAAGFRIRAVSPNLTTIFSERVRGMDRYTRYILPPGTDPAIPPSRAPICLTYAHTPWNNEAVVVQKKYRGAEGVDKRFGNFFSHLFGLGTIDYKDFSAEDAVWLWGADIWQDSDQSLPERRSTQLPLENLHTLIRAGRKLQPVYQSVGQYLPFFIEAYLTRKQNEPLYIAAPADSLDKIIYLLAGLTCCIPLSLFRDLTFSTFESDITKATTQIVGTSWVQGQPTSPPFTPQFYHDKLALNCATGERSNLTNHPRVNNTSWATDFAQYATNWLVRNGSFDKFDDFDALLKRIDLDESLTVEGFLKLFHEEIQSVQITREKIITYLNNPVYRIEKLSESGFRGSIIGFVTDASNPSWDTNSLKPLLDKFLQENTFASGGIGARNGTDQSNQAVAISPQGQGPRRRMRGQSTTSQYTLPEVLSSLARDASAEIVREMRQVGAGYAGHGNIVEADRKIEKLLNLMKSCLLPEDPHQVWHALFVAIRNDQAALTYLTTSPHQNILFKLLPYWDNPGYDAFISSFLVFPWADLITFLGLHLREPNGEWNSIALTNLIQAGQPFTSQIAHFFGPYHPHIVRLFTQLTSRTESLAVAGSFAKLLLRNGYPGNFDYAKLFSLLVTNNVFDAAEALALALTQSGYKGNNAYKQQVGTLLESLLQRGQGLDLFDMLVNSGSFQKESLVNLLLNSPVSQHNLRGVLDRVYQSPSELASFFVNGGKNYLASPEQRQVMIDLFVELLRYEGKWERLVILLGAPEQYEAYVLDVLKRANLTDNELYRVLVLRGKYYLENYKPAPNLAQQIVNSYSELMQKDLSLKEKKELLFALCTAKAHRDHVRILLETAQLSILLTIPEQRQFLDTYGTVYINYYNDIPQIQKCVTGYVKHLTAAQLDPSPFLDVLSQKYRSLSLEDNVQHFMMVYSYIKQPAMDKRASEKGGVLDELAKALFYLDLPNYSALMTKLAQAFMQCVRSPEQIELIMAKMKAVDKKISREQLLYAMAEQFARNSQTVFNEEILAQYFFYVLFEAGTKVGQKRFKVADMHFTALFLDTLLDRYKVTDDNEWKRWDEIVMGWSMSPQAEVVWHDYLRELELLDKIKGQDTAKGTPTKGSKRKGSPRSAVAGPQSKTLLATIGSWFSWWPWGKDKSSPNSSNVAENGKASEEQAPQHGPSANQQSGSGKLYLSGPSSGTRNPSQSPQQGNYQPTQSQGQSWGLNEGDTQNNRGRGKNK